MGAETIIPGVNGPTTGEVPAPIETPHYEAPAEQPLHIITSTAEGVTITNQPTQTSG